MSNAARVDYIIRADISSWKTKTDARDPHGHAQSCVGDARFASYNAVPRPWTLSHPHRKSFRAVESARGDVVLLPTMAGVSPWEHGARCAQAHTITVPIANYDDNNMQPTRTFVCKTCGTHSTNGCAAADAVTNVIRLRYAVSLPGRLDPPTTKMLP